jgi:Flp pilus assembly protein TadD
MGLVILLLVIVAGIGWYVRQGRRRRQAYDLRVSSQGKPKESAAHQAFVHGNTCLTEGKFDEARTAFAQARDLEPNHPHIDSRLAEVERQQVVRTTAAAKATD